MCVPPWRVTETRGAVAGLTSLDSDPEDGDIPWLSAAAVWFFSPLRSLAANFQTNFAIFFSFFTSLFHFCVAPPTTWGWRNNFVACSRAVRSLAGAANVAVEIRAAAGANLGR